MGHHNSTKVHPEIQENFNSKFNLGKRSIYNQDNLN